MKQILLIFVTVLTLTSCQRGCSKCSRAVQTTDLNYEIVMYSGGDTVFHDKVKTIINNAEGSDGIYYYKGDTLIEISGDYVFKAVD